MRQKKIKLKVKYGMKTVFDEEQKALIDCLIRKLFCVMLVERQGWIYMLQRHYNHLKPLHEAHAIKLFRGELKEDTPYLYLYTFVDEM